jgi:hypothetical protein
MADHKALISDGGQTRRVPDADSLIVGAGAKTVAGGSLGRQHADFEKEADLAALTATAERPIFRAEEAVTVTGVHYLPGAALTGDDINNATLIVRRRDSAGATPMTVASLTTTAAPDNSFVAFDAKSLGALTNTAVAADEVLTFEITKAGTGVVVPAGELVVNYIVN